VTHYGLDGLGIESQWRARFSAPLQTGPGAHPASYTMGNRSFPGVKQPVRGIDHPPPYSAEVKERVEIYLCSTSGPSWPVTGRNLPLPFYSKNTNETGSIAGTIQYSTTVQLCYKMQNVFQIKLHCNLLNTVQSCFIKKYIVLN